jgi:gliding motility-associated-like protein
VFALASYDSILCQGATAPLAVVNPNATYTYRWLPTIAFNDSIGINSTLSIQLTGTIYSIEATDTNFCKSTIAINIEESNCFDGEIPELFTPNGDGKNDIFIIDGIENKEAKLNVFNRWGNLIISFYKYNNNWDGTIENKNVPDGVYYYQLEIKGETKPRSGPLTILR